MSDKRRLIEDVDDACPIPPGEKPSKEDSRRWRRISRLLWEGLIGNWKITLSVFSIVTLALASTLYSNPPVQMVIIGTPTAWSRELPTTVYSGSSNDVEWEPLYENLIEHEGDLIVEGDDVFIIENCTFIERGKVVVRDSARLLLRNAELYVEPINLWLEDLNPISLGDTAVFESENAMISYYEEGIRIMANESARIILNSTGIASSLIQMLDDSKIEVRNSSIGRIRLGGNSRCVISKSNVITFSGSENCTSKLFNSKVKGIVLTFGECESTISGRFRGFHTYWNTYTNCCSDGTAFNLTLYDTEITGELGLVVQEDSELVALNQQHLSGITTFGSFSVSNSSCKSLFCVEDSVSYVNETVITYLVVCENSTIAISKSKVGDFYLSEFNGTVRFDEILLEGQIEIWESQCYIYGGVTFGKNCSIRKDLTRKSRVRRGYTVEVTSGTHMLDDVKLRLYNTENELIWSGSTDKKGRAYFNITFYKTWPVRPGKWVSNLDDSWRLEAVKGETCFNTSIGFLTDSPIVFTFPSLPKQPFRMQKWFNYAVIIVILIGVAIVFIVRYFYLK